MEPRPGQPPARTVAGRHVLVSGRVQGVSFRWATAEQARALSVAGWVRNLHDGRVEAWIEAPAQPLATMLAWLRQGPPAARVEDVQVRAVEPEGHARFEIRASARG